MSDQQTTELYCDRATYYKSILFEKLCRSNNVTLTYNEAKEPSTNGVAERNIGNIKQKVSRALHTANLNNQFFGLATMYVIFLMNRTPRRSPDGTPFTPFEKKTGTKPSVASIHTFGSAVTVSVDKNSSTQGKDHQFPIRGIFAGITPNSNSYYIIQLETFSCAVLDDSHGRRVKISEQSPLRCHIDTYWEHPLASVYPPSIKRDNLVTDRMLHLRAEHKSHLQFADNIDTKQTTPTANKEL
jgi:hypothetical protein